MNKLQPIVFRTLGVLPCLALLVLSLTSCAFLGDLTDGFLSDDDSSSRSSTLGRRGIGQMKERGADKSSGESSSGLASATQLHGRNSDDLSAQGLPSTELQNSPLASARISELSETSGSNSAEQPTSIAHPSHSGAAITGLEVTWKIPEIPAEGFVLYFGTASNRLESHVRVASDELETLPDPSSGALYRYIIPDVPPDGPLFVALSSYTGAEEGPRSEALEVRQAKSLNPLAP